MKAYAAATGQDKHSRIVDFDILVKVPKPDFTDITHVVQVDSVDLRLREEAVAIDAGAALPNITDVHMGRAPDLGTY